MTRLILVRHGSTDWNRDKRMQGHSDIELNAEGLKQAETAARALEGLLVDEVYTSDLKRAVETARLIATRHERQPVVDPDLREINEGDWEGLTVEEIRARWPEVWARRATRSRPGGESPEEALARVLSALGRVLQKHNEGTVVVVTSQGVIRLLQGAARGLDIEASASLTGLSPGATLVLDAHLDDSIRLVETGEK